MMRKREREFENECRGMMGKTGMIVRECERRMIGKQADQSERMRKDEV
jgi:hypothetical protein